MHKSGARLSYRYQRGKGSELYPRHTPPLQYFSPYMSVDLHRMAAAFNTDVTSLENELTPLILDGQISARIDSHAKVRVR